jgi:hypothetical protein
MCISITKDIDVNEHQTVSTITLRHKLNYRNHVLIAVLNFTVTVGFSTMRIAHILKWE